MISFKIVDTNNTSEYMKNTYLNNQNIFYNYVQHLAYNIHFKIDYLEHVWLYIVWYFIIGSHEGRISKILLKEKWILL